MQTIKSGCEKPTVPVNENHSHVVLRSSDGCLEALGRILFRVSLSRSQIHRVVERVAHAQFLQKVLVQRLHVFNRHAVDVDHLEAVLSLKRCQNRSNLANS